MLDTKYLHHFVPQVIDYLNRDPPILGFLERSRCVAVERRPGFFVDLGFQGGLQCAVRVLGAEEIGVADEEAFLVVVRVDERALSYGPCLRSSAVLG